MNHTAAAHCRQTGREREREWRQEGVKVERKGILRI